MSESDSAGCAVVIAGALIWFGVHQYNRANDLQNKLVNAQAQIDDLKTKSAALEDASDKLKEQMARFDDENWRDVVPDAKDAAGDVDTAKDDLATSADDAGSEDEK